MDSNLNDNITNGNSTDGSSVCPSLAVSSPNSKRRGEPLADLRRKSSRLTLHSKPQSIVSQNGADGHPTLPVAVENQGSNKGETNASAATNGVGAANAPPAAAEKDQGSAACNWSADSEFLHHICCQP